MRQIALDTETTGLEVKDGHRILEIGCVEIINRTISGQTFHAKINPEREVDKGAQATHGYTWKMLKGSPLFADICDDLLSFVGSDEVVIHNAEFDLGFLDAELKRMQRLIFKKEVGCRVIDTLRMARKKHRGQPASLNALCDRYGIDRSDRQLHGALKDANLLAKVYLAMTSGQTNISFDEPSNIDTLNTTVADAVENLSAEDLKVIEATAEELDRHEKFIASMNAAREK
ncbi:MAG: DNA polymerase III subunit epsilon [Chromatiales bacterium]|nr:DNA polymerase III subunit epsilon [Chromatiales bacterium]